MKLRLLLPLISILFLSSCYGELEVVEVEDFANVEIGFKGMKSDLLVRVYNPNFLSINIQSAEIALQVGEVNAGDVVLSEPTILVGRDTSSVLLKVATHKGALGQIIKDNFTLILQGGEVSFSAEGIIKGRTLGVNIEVPISHTQLLEL
jgi:LEA14-like dessication related protein